MSCGRSLKVLNLTGGRLSEIIDTKAVSAEAPLEDFMREHKIGSGGRI